ncbi:hypothetical protein [Teredinibacter sp. KSP-S5-2]|uniref:hypothetical protein n=1 Tax=Teredinibacter sp. KSP-S5-2 TaxID=3034506 RepID=UPI002934174A|nr:hypothetical protein [Teredinibacter sp. KSP-S5-2]WNO09025.1 hypothetical protein P5V12_18950 [Teredinibacter sp. KSP-S5-2]
MTDMYVLFHLFNVLKIRQIFVMNKSAFYLLIIFIFAGCAKSPYPKYDYFYDWFKDNYEVLNALYPYIVEDREGFKIWTLEPLRYKAKEGDDYIKVIPKHIAIYEKLIQPGPNVFIKKNGSRVVVSLGVGVEGLGNHFFMSAVRGDKNNAQKCTLELLRTLNGRCYMEFYKEWHLEYYGMKHIYE